MSTEITVLLTQQSTPGSFVSERKPGAGYHQKYDNLHTFIVTLDNWNGELRIQGTLDLFPGEDSWVDLIDTAGDLMIYTSDSGTSTANVRGNFVWIRAVGVTIEGSVQQIQFSH